MIVEHTVRLSALAGCFATPQSPELFEAFRHLNIFDAQQNGVSFYFSQIRF